MNLNVNESAIKLAEVLGKVTDKAFSKNLSKVVKGTAIIGAITWALPLFGLETIIYAFVLWRMYKKICDEAGVPFRVKSIIVGFIINIIMSAVVNWFLDAIGAIGWVVACVVGGASIIISGIAYLDALTLFYKEDLKTTVNTEGIIDAYKEVKNTIKR